MNTLRRIASKVLDDFWAANLDRQGWHAYGLRAQENRLRAALFVQPGFSESAEQAFRNTLIESVRLKFIVEDKAPPPPNILALLFEFVRTQRFHGMHTGNKFRNSITGRPGARVFTTSPRCGQGCFGTIGGFLKKEGSPETDPVWLMTNHHILADREECAQSALVRGAGGTPLSQNIRFVPLRKGKPNYVDVAIAEIKNRKTVAGTYPKISITCPSPKPVRDKMVLQKLGNATNMTTGTFLWCCPKAVVVSCGGQAFEMQSQIVIGSKSKSEPFLAHGDSGSLVIGDNHPVGLLHAITSKAILPEEIKRIAAPPLGLANQFGVVLKELNDKTGLGPLQLILNPGRGVCLDSHCETGNNDCSTYLDEILEEFNEPAQVATVQDSP